MESNVALVDQAYFIRHAALERDAAQRASERGTQIMHEDAARVYDALAAKAVTPPAIPPKFSAAARNQT